MLKVIENSGLSRDEAIVIETDNHIVGVMVEYASLEKRFGERGQAWELLSQLLMTSDDGERSYDAFALKFPDGTSTTVYFDITSFFGT
jgi:predicted neutral ceramidase superfamily lipid hydrolase